MTVFLFRNIYVVLTRSKTFTKVTILVIVMKKVTQCNLGALVFRYTRCLERLFYSELWYLWIFYNDKIRFIKICIQRYALFSWISNEELNWRSHQKIYLRNIFLLLKWLNILYRLAYRLLYIMQTWCGYRETYSLCILYNYPIEGNGKSRHRSISIRCIGRTRSASVLNSTFTQAMTTRCFSMIK